MIENCVEGLKIIDNVSVEFLFRVVDEFLKRSIREELEFRVYQEKIVEMVQQLTISLPVFNIIRMEGSL